MSTEPWGWATTPATTSPTAMNTEAGLPGTESDPEGAAIGAAAIRDLIGRRPPRARLRRFRTVRERAEVREAAEARTTKSPGLFAHC